MKKRLFVVVTFVALLVALVFSQRLGIWAAGGEGQSAVQSAQSVESAKEQKAGEPKAGNEKAEKEEKVAAPAFTLKDLQGKDVSLADFKGKNMVMLNFFTTWCPYCKEEIPDLIKLQDKYGSKGFKIIGIDVDESKEKVESFTQKYKINYTVILDEKQEAAQAYHIPGYPTSFLIDKEGNMKFWFNQLPTSLNSELDKMLAE